MRSVKLAGSGVCGLGRPLFWKENPGWGTDSSQKKGLAVELAQSRLQEGIAGVTRCRRSSVLRRFGTKRTGLQVHKAVVRRRSRAEGDDSRSSR